MTNAPGLIIAAAGAGIAGGLFLLARGLLAYQAGEAVRGTGSSRIESLAAGEVRLVGTIEPGPVTLVSPLQAVPCVYYHARIVEERGRERTTTLDEERAAGFRIRDATGTLRVFPRGARWDVPECFNEQSSWAGADPPGLNLNLGPGVTSAVLNRDAAIAALLTVRSPDGGAEGTQHKSHGAGGLFATGLGGGAVGLGGRRRHYAERRLAPGDFVTLVGSAVPFRDIDDPATADLYEPALALNDPEVAMNLAEAREAGILKMSPEEAWGNAAIPGFGIGEPTRAPELDPAARPLPIASAGTEAAAALTFDIPPGELVVAVVPGNPLVVRAGNPGEVVARDRGALILGLVGAAGAIACALILALALQGAPG